MNWKIFFIGLVLIGFSAFVQAAYNPYINNAYSRPYYTQFHAPPGIPRVAQVYYGTNVYNYAYSNGWENFSESVVQNPYYSVGYGNDYYPYYNGAYGGYDSYGDYGSYGGYGAYAGYYPYYYQSPGYGSYPTVSLYDSPVRAQSYGFNVVYYS